jgi:hypothetical protein
LLVHGRATLLNELADRVVGVIGKEGQLLGVNPFRHGEAHTQILVLRQHSKPFGVQATRHFEANERILVRCESGELAQPNSTGDPTPHLGLRIVRGKDEGARRQASDDHDPHRIVIVGQHIDERLTR